MGVLRIAASTNNVTISAGQRITKAWLVAGADAASALIYDAATATGTEILGLKAAAAQMSPQLELCSAADSGVKFSTGLSVTLTGTSPVLYLIVT